jgi:hypothetical protein
MRTPLGLLLPPPSTESRFRSHRQRDHLSPEVDEEEEEPSLAYTLVAGAMAGVISKTAVAPLERAKIYFMTNEQDKFRLRRMVKWLKLSYRGEVRTYLLFKSEKIGTRVNKRALANSTLSIYSISHIQDTGNYIL